jgi:ABC-type multidrug transport system fused ATPase/permease subunit
MPWRMRSLPLVDPGAPDTRSPARLLVWVGRGQLGTLSLGIAFGILWMVAQVLMPYTIGRGVQDGIVEDDRSGLVTWALLLLGLGLVQGAAGVLRHRLAVQNWLLASFRLVQVVAHHAARTGPAVRGRLSTGEVVATVTNDAIRAGGAFDITARLAGAIVSYVVVAAIQVTTTTNIPGRSTCAASSVDCGVATRTPATRTDCERLRYRSRNARSPPIPRSTRSPAAVSAPRAVSFPTSSRCSRCRAWSGRITVPRVTTRTGTPTRTISPSVTEVERRIAATTT